MAGRKLQDDAIPIALIGAGVAWLAIGYATRRRARAEDAAGHFAVYEGYDEDEGLGARLRSTASQAKARMARAASQARERLALARAELDEARGVELLTAGAVGLAVGAAIGAGVMALLASRDEADAAQRKAAKRAKALLEEANVLAGFPLAAEGDETEGRVTH